MTGRSPDVEFTALGDPAPKGSKSFKGMRGGRAILVESSKKLRPWADAVAWAGRAAMGFRPPLEGPLGCTVIFTVPKPTGAPKRRRTWPCKKPDADKLVRAAFDSMTTCGVWRDDAQVVELISGKRFPNEGVDALPCSGVIVRVWRVE